MNEFHQLAMFAIIYNLVYFIVEISLSLWQDISKWKSQFFTLIIDWTTSIIFSLEQLLSIFFVILEFAFLLALWVIAGLISSFFIKMVVTSIQSEHFDVHQVHLVRIKIYVPQYIIEDLISEIDAVLFDQNDAFIKVWKDLIHIMRRLFFLLFVIHNLY